MIALIPSDNAGGNESQAQELSVEAESYESALAALRGQLPEGWRIINLRRLTP